MTAPPRHQREFPRNRQTAATGADIHTTPIYEYATELLPEGPGCQTAASVGRKNVLAR